MYYIVKIYVIMLMKYEMIRYILYKKADYPGLDTFFLDRHIEYGCTSFNINNITVRDTI